MVHFVVEGSCLVDVARNMLLSDRPENAMRLLVESIPDLPGKIAQQILDGHKTLIGDSDAGIQVASETPAERDAFVETRRGVFAGRVRVGEGWYRPRAIVADRGEEDALWALGALGLTEVPMAGGDYRATARYRRLEAELLRDGRMLPDEDLGPAILREFSLLRHQHYAGDGERALYVRRADAPCRDQVEIVIFEPCGALPSWWSTRTDLAEALDEFRNAGGYLERRGCTARYDETAPSRVGASALATAVADRATQAELEAAYAEEDRREAERMAGYRAEILRRAGGDLFEFSWGAGEERRTVFVPRAPFEVYVTHRTKLCALAPKWDPVCPSGIKMQNDDPYHTDWMVGAGLDDLAICYEDEAFRDALDEATFAVQQRLGNFQCAVLADAGAVAGPVALPGEGAGGGILVLPNLDPRYLADMLRAAAVVTANGGAAAHLASVARDRGLTVVRVAEAHRIYKSGMYLRIEPADGLVEIDRIV